MPRLIRMHAIIFLIATYFAGLPADARADFLLFDSGIEGFALGQFDSEGGLVRYIGNVPDSIYEESYDDFILSSDQKTFYVSGNSLGNITVYPYDASTGNYIGPYIEYDDGFGNNVYRQYYSPYDPRLPDGTYRFGFASDAIGDEFHIVGIQVDSLIPGGPPISDVPVIISYKTAGELLKTTPFLSGKSIWGFQVLPSGQFMVFSDGVYVGGSGGFAKIIEPTAGEQYYAYDFAISPDNLIYILDPGNTEIRRYDQNGNFLGALLQQSDFDMELQSMQFGPNGDLYVLGAKPVPNDHAIPTIKRFDLATGQFVSETLFDPEFSAHRWVSEGVSGFHNRFYILIPEPTTLALSLASLAGICAVRASRRRLL